MINEDRVLKRYTEQAVSFGLADNEVKWYQQFNKFEGIRHIPKMLDFTRDTIVLEYVGNPIPVGMQILNIKNQLRQIASFLESQHCQHCDINPNNLLVKGINVFLIDFGWAVETGQNPYQRWKHVNREILKCIGTVYRGPNWPDNRYSLNKVYGELSGNKNDKIFF